MKINKRIARKTILKFSKQLSYCHRAGLNKDEVVKFFGKPRAAKWCGSWGDYPDVAMAIWWENRYDDNFIWD